MKKAYVVMGSTGEYSDWQTWIVGVFEDKEAAEAFARECIDVMPDAMTYEDRHRYEHPLDPNCRIDYTGVSYEVVESVWG